MQILRTINISNKTHRWKASTKRLTQATTQTHKLCFLSWFYIAVGMNTYMSRMRHYQGIALELRNANSCRSILILQAIKAQETWTNNREKTHIKNFFRISSAEAESLLTRSVHSTPHLLKTKELTSRCLLNQNICSISRAKLYNTTKSFYCQGSTKHST